MIVELATNLVDKAILVAYAFKCHFEWLAIFVKTLEKLLQTLLIFVLPGQCGHVDN